MIENYEINENTLAVIATDIYQTKIIETEKEFIVDKKAYEIMEESCEYYGSTYVGRLNAAKKILNCSYKLPILVEESSSLIFFPTKSSLVDDCSWINYNAIKNYSYQTENNKLNLDFINGTKIELDISKLSFQNQIYKSTQLESILRRRNLKK